MHGVERMASGSFKAALLIGLATSMAMPSLAQQPLQGVGQQGPVQTNSVQQGPAQRTGAVAMPTVPPQSTASTSIVLPIVPASNGSYAMVYRPDAGGPLSGLPYDRKAEAPLTTAPIGTLGEAITLAYRTNPQLLSARALARSTDYRVPQARSAFGPTLSATGAYTFTRTRSEIVPDLFVGNQGWASTASLVLNQPVYTFGRNAANAAGAVATSEYQRDVLRLTEAQVLNNVVIAYVSVLRDAAAVTISRENLALLERQFGDNTKRYEFRDLTQTDLDQTRTRVEAGRAQLLQSIGQLGISQKQFLQYVGAPPGELAPPDILDVTFGSIEAAYGYAEANSALIRAAQARERISRAAVEAAKAESLPRVDLRGTADYGSMSPYTDRLRTTQLLGQVVVSQPLIDSGLRRARQGEAREANQSDWRLLDTALRDTREEIGSAWDQLAATRASLTGYRAAIEAAERAYQGALVQQRAGDRSTLDVLDLARDLLSVRTTYNQTIASEYLSRANLLAAAGMLEGPLMVSGLTGYDAEGHYDRVRRKADIPLLTPALATLDSVTNRDTRRNRPSRDAGAVQALDESQALVRAPAVTQ